MKSNKVHFLDCTEDTLHEYEQQALQGNIPAKLNIVLHNQGVLNDKLNQLLAQSSWHVKEEVIH